MTSDEMPVIDAEPVEEESQAALAVAHPAALEAMERAQQDVMIQTAKRYPRPKLQNIRERMVEFATVDAETAEACFYTLKRKNKQGKETLIQGPSIRLAEIALVCYQNIRAGSRVIANDGKKITSQGICFDAENNVMIAVEESRSILYSKSNRPFSEDMQIVTGRANNSIARRNAILEVIPRVLTNAVYEIAKQHAVGDAKSLEDHRAKVLKRFAQMGVSIHQILHVLGREMVEMIDLDDLQILIGLGTSIKDGLLTIDEAFAAEAPGEEETSAPKQKLAERLRAAREKTKEAPK